MSAPFRVSPHAMGKVMNLGDLDGSGMLTTVQFDPHQGMIVRKVIPERVMQAIRDTARDQRDIHRKGTMIGNTQRHWRPVASMPKVLYDQWERELGPRKHNEKAWKRRFNSNEFRDLRTSEGTV